MLVVKPSINGKQASALVDSGASANFLDDAFAKKNSVPVEAPAKQATVKLGDGSACKAAGTANKVPTKFQTYSERVNYVVMKLGGKYDAVLGMPWLKKHRAKINWDTGLIKSRRKKRIDSKPPRPPRPSPPSSPVFMNLEEVIAPAEDDEEYRFMAFVSEAKPDAPSTGRYAHFLEEFADVGPDELPAGLPPTRGAEMRVRLVPHQQPPFRPTYHMARKELEELKKQLDRPVSERLHPPKHFALWCSRHIR